MTALTLQRTSAAKAAWIIGLLFFAWLAFLLVPVSLKRTGAAKPVAPVPSSTPRPAGLAENPDWDGLSEHFAIWADSAEWKDGKTQFAYWHPGRRAYEYYFEATRKDGRVRFRPLYPDEALAGREFTEDGHYREVTGRPVGIQTPSPNFESESPTHPFLFFHEIDRGRVPTYDHVIEGVVKEQRVAPRRATVDLGPTPKLDPSKPPAPDDPAKK